MSAVIEFAGIPGSGKSHISRILRKQMRRDDIPFTNVDKFVREQGARKIRAVLESDLNEDARVEKLSRANKKEDFYLRWFGAFFRQHHSFVHLYSTTLFDRETDEAVIRSVLLTFMYSSARYAYCTHKKKSAPGEILIQEEGAAHRLFTLFGYDRTEREAGGQVRALCELIPVPTALIWTRCRPALAVDRMLQRPRKQLPERLEGLDRSEIERILERGSVMLETGLEVLSRRGCKIVEVSTDQETDSGVLSRSLFKRLELPALVQATTQVAAK